MSAERVKLLFLDDERASFRPLVRLAPAADPRLIEQYASHPRERTRRSSNALRSQTFSTTSTASRSRRDSNTESTSRRSSGSSESEAPSIHLAPPWVKYPPAAMTALDYSYDLPCEFSEIYGCQVRYHPEDFEDWIAHSRTHFVDAPPPQRAVCLFCDKVPDGFESWRKRMIHVGEHYHYLTRHETMRPDFVVLKHLYRNNLLSSEELESHMGYSERAPCDNLVEDGFQTSEMVVRERERAKYFDEDVKQTHNSRREDRMMRESRGSRKKERTHKSSHSSRVYHEPRS